MKKNIVILFLGICFILINTAISLAVDFKVKGQFVFSYELGEGGTGDANVYGFNGDDAFNAEHRIRLQIDAVASEALSGTIFFEIGDSSWGKQSHGAALGTDMANIEVKRAYIDYITPESTQRVRMGLQGLGLPSYTTGTSQVFDNDVAGLVLNNKYTDNVSLTMFWVRPFNDNYVKEYRYADEDNTLDNVDMVGLSLPMTFDGYKLNPWVMYTAVGANTFRGSDAPSRLTPLIDGLLPITGVPIDFSGGSPVINTGKRLQYYGNVWHAGITGEFDFNSAFNFAFDFNYGNADFGPNRYKRAGFYASALAEYSFDWGVPGFYVWYSSGDNDDLGDGSERMPTLGTANGVNGFSSFGSSGAEYIDRDNIIGETLVGTWGIGLRVKDFSFMPNMEHTFAINYYGGTNDIKMAQYLDSFNAGYGMYLTENDYAVEFNFTTDYKIYENLLLQFHASYIVLGFDEDVWRHSNYDETDAWNVSTSFVYKF